MYGGRYTIHAPIGAGGMVWLLTTLVSDVALAQVPADKAKVEADARLRVDPALGSFVTVQMLTVPDLLRERPVAFESLRLTLPTSPDREPGKSAQAAGAILLGVGAVGVMTGGYFGIRAYKQSEEADRLCRGSICTIEGVESYAAAQRSAWYSNAGFGLGLAGFATGLYILLVSPRASTSNRGGLRIEGGIAHLRLKGQF
jgi:hypothetical protein